MKNTASYILDQYQQNLLSRQRVEEMLEEIRRAVRGARVECQEVAESAGGVAIIGMAGRFPQSENLQQFWQHLIHGHDLIRPLPSARRRDIDQVVARLTGERPPASYRPMAFLDEIDKFDAAFFNIAPGEAISMDPQQRLILEVAWEAFENAGLLESQIFASNTGVFLGWSPSLYATLASADDPLSISGTLPAFTASRIAYCLDLKGPCELIDTLCSSSLVAIHRACNALRQGECDQALAGGVKLQLNPAMSPFSKSGLFSADGRCKSFDARADGIGCGEGAAVVLLKPLSKARQDGDWVHAVIRASAVNHGGHSNGITAPNGKAQSAVIRKAWEAAHIEPESIAYIEAHGSGTLLGDAVEWSAIEDAMCSLSTNQRIGCPIGSVKSNIGHLDSAAGIAGLVKAVLMLQHEAIPPSLHFQRPNPHHEPRTGGVYVNTVLMPCAKDRFPLRAAVNSFGLSGTNAHVVLEAYSKDFGVQSEKDRVFTLSAKSRGCLWTSWEKCCDELSHKTEAEFAHICYSSNRGRSSHPHRLAVVAKNLGELVKRLKALSPTTPPDRMSPSDAYLSHGNGSYNNQQLSQAHAYAKAFVDGQHVEWDSLYEEALHRIPLPNSVFNRRRYWIEPQESATPNVESILWQIKWEELPSRSPSDLLSEDIILVFARSDDTGAALVRHFRTHCARVVVVRIGRKFERSGFDKFAIAPGDPSHYTRLADCLRAVQLLPTRIVHAWSLTAASDSMTRLADLETLLREGVESVLFLVQALDRCGLSRTASLNVIANGVQRVTLRETVLHPDRGATWGLMRVVPQEFSFRHTVCVDVADDLMTDGGLTNVHRAILFAERHRERSVAVRDQKWFAPRLEPISRNVVAASTRFETTCPDGVYWIIGGAGRIGRASALHLAQQGARTLVLTGRSESLGRSVELQRDLQLIRATGSQVVYRSVDVTDRAKMAGFVRDVELEYGSLRGIIHAAGVFEHGRLADLSYKQFRAVLDCKVLGLWILNEVVQHCNLEFLYLYSSIASVLGGETLGAYAAANGFLDHWAEARCTEARKITAVNFALVSWDESPDSEHLLFRRLDRETFKVVLSELGRGTRGARLIVADFRRSVLRQLESLLQVRVDLSARTADYSGAAQSKVSRSLMPTVSFTAPCALERSIVAIWQEVLGVPDIREDQHFFDIGNSLLAIKTVQLMNDRLGLSLGVGVLFSYPTVSSLADEIRQREDSNLDQVLANVERGVLPINEAVSQLSREPCE